MVQSLATTANAFDCFSVTFLGRFREAGALMDADGYVRPCEFLQEVQLPYYAAVMEHWLHVQTVGVLMQQCGGYCRRSLVIGVRL